MTSIIRDAIAFAKFYSRSRHAVIRVYDETRDVIEAQELDLFTE